jgi:DNA-binding transcriptional MerR regulator
MFSIGQFSRISGLTIKTIRLYHDRQLLAPDMMSFFLYNDIFKYETDKLCA